MVGYSTREKDETDIPSARPQWELTRIPNLIR
jgi:hypothetical protein